MSTIFNPLMSPVGKIKPVVTLTKSTSSVAVGRPKTAKLLTKPEALFNPLDNVVQASSNGLDLESTSAIHNMTVGTCPKCQTSMGTGVLSNQDSVYFCHNCAVSTPVQDGGPQVQPSPFTL